MNAQTATSHIIPELSRLLWSLWRLKVFACCHCPHLYKSKPRGDPAITTTHVLNRLRCCAC